MKKILLVGLLSIFIIIWGSSVNAVTPAESDLTKEQKEQIEKKFNLPPEPNPEVNNATVLGVDTNNNKFTV